MKADGSFYRSNGFLLIVLNERDFNSLPTIGLTDSYLQLFPNPVNHQLNFISETIDYHQANLSILNATGQIVYSEDMGNLLMGQTYSMITSHLKSGVYIFQIKSREGVYRTKFIKN
jgi:hypothetical protein